MQVRQVALTSEMSNNEISPSELGQVAGALQLQASEGLNRAWHFHAVVQAYPDPKSIPAGWDYIKVQARLDDPGALGYHSDANGQPYALVEYVPNWTAVVSHEWCELLGDPFGYHVYRAPSPNPEEVGPRGGKVYVRILLELCDPCEDDRFGYLINGVPVSDFILHPYGNGKSGPYDAGNHIQQARQVLTNGYISWVEDDGTWKQLTNFNDNRQVTVLGKATDRKPNQSLREWVDAHENGASRQIQTLRRG